MMQALKGQVALVTGGGRGLGRSIAKALAAQGAAVAVDDLHRDENGTPSAALVAKEIEQAGGNALALQEDVTSAAGAQVMVDAVVQRFERIDILVTCAGNFHRTPLAEMSEQQWDSIIDLHLKGHFLSCRMAVPHMLKQNSGRILTVSSRGAFFQVPASKRVQRDVRKPSGTAYAAAKAGIMGFTTTLAVELWDTGINVNCLLPSATTQLFPESKARLVGGVPAAESLDPDDVAPAAVFLCSPDAADISGKFMYAGGGDLVFYGDQLDMRGARMVRKAGRWTQGELARVVPSLLGI
ncbi:MAG: SDR family NAD(P)-dependent oxidoreductase [Rubrivivax sp.]